MQALMLKPATLYERLQQLLTLLKSSLLHVSVGVDVPMMLSVQRSKQSSTVSPLGSSRSTDPD